MSDVTFRPPTNEDLNFIVNSWLKSYREAQPAVPNAQYYEGQKRLILDLLSRCDTVLAVDPEAPSHVLGYLCYERGSPDVIHFVYVKFALRRNGLASLLVERAGISLPCIVTHITKPAGMRLFTDMAGQFIYDPYATRKES